MSPERSPKLEDFQEGLPDPRPSGGRPSGRRRLRVALGVMGLVVLALAFAALTQRAQVSPTGGSGGITGQVVLEDGRPLQATVIVVGAGISVQTDTEGRFALSRVPAGDQDLVVGYRGAGREVPIRVVAGETMEIGQIRFISTLEPDQ